MRRWINPIVAGVTLISGLAACSSPQVTAPKASNAPKAPPPPSWLLTTANGVEVVSSTTGSVRDQVADGVASADGSSIVATEGDHLVVRNARTGAVKQAVAVPPGLVVASVSADGQLVALGTTRPSPYLAAGRTHTQLVVVHLPVGNVTRFNLGGNMAPDAFSADGGNLYLVSYLPPEAPDHYQITSLALGSGEVAGVFGREKEPPEDMRGVAGTRVLSPDGNTLYTLYLRPPAAPGAGSGDPLAEVHTLKLDQGWAHCIDLPAGFGSSNLSGSALALSDTGSRLYVVDRAMRRLVEVDAVDLTIVRSVSVPLTSPSSPTSLAVGGDGHLYLSDGPSVLVLSTATLDLVARWPVVGPVTGLMVAAPSNDVLVSRPGQVDVFGATGSRHASIPVPSDATTVSHVLT